MPQNSTIYWNNIEERKKRIANEFAITLALLEEIRLMQQQGKNLPFNEQTIEVFKTTVQSLQKRLLVNISEKKADYLSDGALSEKEWTDKACDQALHFAVTLKDTVHMTKDCCEQGESTYSHRHLQEQFSRLNVAARGSTIPPKVTLAAQSLTYSLLLPLGICLLIGLSNPPVFLAALPVLVPMLVIGMTILASAVYHSGKSAERAEHETKRRNEKMSWVKTFKHYFLTPPKEKPADEQEQIAVNSRSKDK